MKINIPYGSSSQQLIIDDIKAELLKSHVDELKSDLSEDDLVLNAMASPINSLKLCELAKDKRSAVIIISDHTRPVPSKHIIPFMLAEMRKFNPAIDITLLVATGFHRLTDKKELIAKLGEKIVAEEKIAVHESQNSESNVKIGVLPSGADLVIDRLAWETDLLVSEGFIEPHFFAGFSGGRKSVLPGVCSKITVLGNHCSKFIDSPYARTGSLQNNPLHIDMVAAAKMANLAYIVNVIINDEKQVVAAFAGDPFIAHEKGCEFIGKYCRVATDKTAEIVISSNGGAPLDQNVYQAVKGLTAAESAAAPGAILIMCAECKDGTGGESFYKAMKDCKSPSALLEQIRKVPMDKTEPDQWEYQILARILEKHRTIFVSCPEMKSIIEDMKLEYAETLQQAWNQAYAIKPNAKTAIIENGVSIIVN